MTIRTLTIYLDDAGRPIEEHRPIPAKGELITMEAPTYVAPITAQFEGPGGQPMQAPLKIVLDGVDNVHDAYEQLQAQVDAKAPDMIKRHIDNMKNQMRRQSLARPTG